MDEDVDPHLLMEIQQGFGLTDTRTAQIVAVQKTPTNRTYKVRFGDGSSMVGQLP